MRVMAVMLLAAVFLAGWAWTGWAEASALAATSKAGPLPVTLAPPESGSLASFTIVDWVNGLAFDLDPRMRVVVQPHCNLTGGFTLAWPEADTDCDPEAVFAPDFTLEVSAYHSYLPPVADGAELELIPAEDVGSQARLDALMAAWPGRAPAGEALVRTPGGTITVPCFTWREAGALPDCLDYAVYQPDAASGPQIVTLTLRCTSEPAPELIELAATRLLLFAASQE
jgi:hypothetical protein